MKSINAKFMKNLADDALWIALDKVSSAKLGFQLYLFKLTITKMYISCFNKHSGYNVKNCDMKCQTLSITVSKYCNLIGPNAVT